MIYRASLLTALLTITMEVLSFESSGYEKTSFGQVDSPSPSNFDHHPLLQTLKKYQVFEPRQYEDHQHTQRKPGICTELRNETGLHAARTYFTIEFEGRTYDLDVSINRALLPQSFYVSDILSNGKVRVHRPTTYEQNHCYYQGKIRGVSDSQVIMSTCHGLKGCVILPDDLFIFEPLSNTTSSLFQDVQHVIYRLKDVIRSKPHGTCGQHDSASDLQSIVYNLDQFPPEPYDDSTSRKRRNTGFDKRYVELLLVVDYALAQRLATQAAIQSHVKELVNYIDGFYQKLDIRVVLSGVEVWSTEDRINISSVAEETLDEFLAFRKRLVTTELPTSAWVYADNVHLLHGGFFNGTTVGLGSVGTMCSVTSAGVNQDADDNIFQTANVLAHEMGHNFGLPHTNDKCSCPNDTDCIMAPSVGFKAKKDWATCSRTKIHEDRTSASQKCLYNIPVPSRVYLGPECGNDIVEEDEECDCGPPEYCDSKCCNATSCKLLPSTACDLGPCCYACQYLSSDVECRGTNDNECDFPEHCTGDSAECPDDIHVEDGYTCLNETAVCADGVCLTHDLQCQTIWGPTASKSIGACYYHINMLGDTNGNCGQNKSGTNYLKCTTESTECGKLLCSGGGDAPVAVGEHNLFLNRIKLQGDATEHKCKTIASAPGSLGLVQSGTICSEGKVCHSGVCETMKPLTCSPTCNGHGKCNDLGICHCDPGFPLPHCKAMEDEETVDGGNSDNSEDHGNKGDGDNDGNGAETGNDADSTGGEDSGNTGNDEKDEDRKDDKENADTEDKGSEADNEPDTEREEDMTEVLLSEDDGETDPESENDANDKDGEDSDLKSNSFDWQMIVTIASPVAAGSAAIISGSVVAYNKCGGKEKFRRWRMKRMRAKTPQLPQAI